MRFSRCWADCTKQHPGQGYDRKAFEIFEHRQRRVFLEQMGKTGTRRFAGVPNKLRQREEQLGIQLDQMQHNLSDELARPRQTLERVTELERRITALKGEERTLRSTLQSRCPEYYALRFPQPIDLNELRSRTLRPDELMLAYHVMSENTILWLIGTQQTQMYLLPIGRIRHSTTSRGYAPRHAVRLYRQHGRARV